MPEPKPPGAPESTAHQPTGDERPGPVVVHGEIVFPEGVEPADDAPTIISKKVSARHGPPGQSADSLVSGSLRGRTLAHFELIEPIGVGGMAAVIRARDRQLDRPVALKILPPEMAGDPENVLRFHQEARAAAKLDHENIARVFFCGEDQRLHFIAFEFVEGVNLRTLLEKRGRLPVHEAVHYMLQIATGLAHAAARGVVHRDIKPSNIIISPNGRAKLVDMGLARNMGPQSDRDLTQSGVTLGTFDYIAPEQAMDPREADVRSDIYSLGCTFYHMLTGQAPVPEGTAAKKLHHHQHVAPVDPRQLNPNIPDDVAAILQRMMAKDPRERYQRAEHLVQHLIQVAQKLGAVTDLPDGVLFVDAPLPSPPRKRPLLMAAVGVLLLGVLLIVLSLAPGRPANSRHPGLPPANDRQAAAPKNQDLPRTQDKQKVEPPLNERNPRPVATEQELRAALEGKKPATHLQVVGDFPIKSGVRLAGRGERPLVIESQNAGKPAVLRVMAPHSAEAAPWGGLEINGGSVTFKNLVFEVDADADLPSLVAGVLVKRGTTVTFKRCRFLQSRWPGEGVSPRPGPVPVASVAVWRPDGDAEEPPVLAFEECYFQRGQDAVLVRGPAVVRPTNCAFGPHLALFHLRSDENRGAATHLELNSVSALVVYGPAFRLDKDAACDIDVRHSIFSCPDRSLYIAWPDLIGQTSPRARLVRFQGTRNCYHNLNALWSGRAGNHGLTNNMDDFRSALQEARGSYDEQSSCLQPGASPWAREGTLALSQKEPAEAFRVNPRLPEVRTDNNSADPLGVKKCVFGDMPRLPELPSVIAVAKAKRKPNEKVVDPDDDGQTPGVFRTLAAAVAEANDGDIILIKHNGFMPIRPVNLKVAQELTIRPDEGFRPVLTLDKKTLDAEAMFTFYHGQIRFEDLGFLFKPASPKLQAVVALKGNGLCLFKRCVATLEQPEGGAVPLSLVALSEPSREAMQMAPAEMKEATAIPKVAKVVLEACFIRGEGDLLAVRPSRPVVLELNGSLAVLYGSLVSVEGNPAEPMAGTAEIKLNQTTTYLQEHLVSLRGKNAKGLVFTQVTAEDSLFVAAVGKTLVHLEGPDGEEQMKRVFDWFGKRNTYSGFDKVLEQQSNADAGMGGRLAYDQDRWKRFAKETDPEPRFVQMRFAVPESDHPFSQALPEQFRATRSEPQVDFERCGAPIAQLPAPYTSGVARPSSGTPDDKQPGAEPEDARE